MPGKGQGGASLSIGQYSHLVLEKYLRHQFSQDKHENLKAAAEELYVLLHKLRAAASKDSEDSKAPLKAIRNAIDHFVFHGARGADSGEVEALLQLYAALEEACVRRIARGGEEAEGALQVQDALRYRMTRLVTGDAWDSRPQLKLRVLKLMFRFMVRENDRMLAASRSLGPHQRGDLPLRRLSRSASSGKKAVAAAPCSRWGEAINEMSRMQGSRVLPLLKLALLENLGLSEAAATAAAAAAAAEETPTPADAADAATPRHLKAAAAPAGPSPAASESAGSSDGAAVRPGTGAGAGAAPPSPATPAQPRRLGSREPPPPPTAAAAATRQGQQQEGQGQPVPGVDDLLGLFAEPLPQEEQAQPSPSSSGAGMTAEQLFAAFDDIGPTASPGSGGNPFLAASWARQPQPAGFGPQPPPEAVGSQLGSMTISGVPPAVPSPYAQPSAVWQQGGFFPLAPEPSAHSAPTKGTSGSWSYVHGHLSSQGSGSELYRHSSNPLFDQAFDQPGTDASPRSMPSRYLGKTNPFGDTRFSELAPQLQVLRPPPPPAPPAGPPMRSASLSSNK